MSAARKGKEFGARVKAAALKRANGLCEECKQPLKAASFQIDHIQPIALGGDNSLENAAVLCTPCHKIKTKSEDMPVITKADAQKKAHTGMGRAKVKIPTPPKTKREPRRIDLDPLARRSLYR